MAPAMVRLMLRDDGESVELMEPMLPPDGHPRQDDLEDLTVELVQKASALAGRLHPIVRDGVGALVRSMNCYYSNLIEGHDTHPVDIERALKRNYSADPKKRSLQLEAAAHIEVQGMIDGGQVPDDCTAPEYIQFLHRAFCERLPTICSGSSTRRTARRCGSSPASFASSMSRSDGMWRSVPVPCRDSFSAMMRHTGQPDFRGFAAFWRSLRRTTGCSGSIHLSTGMGALAE
jgi:hypothetical protein